MNPTQYWDQVANDPDVDNKYICDIPIEDCLKDIGKLQGKVLEIGSGVGRLLQPGWYGIDLSANMLAIANIRTGGKCYFKKTDGDIPYSNEYFDSIFCYLVLQHLKPDEVKRYISEAYRALKTNGIFKFQFIQGTEREPLSNHYTTDEISRWLTEAGFESVTYKPSKAHYLWTIAEVQK